MIFNMYHLETILNQFYANLDYRSSWYYWFRPAEKPRVVTELTRIIANVRERGKRNYYFQGSLTLEPAEQKQVIQLFLSTPLVTPALLAMSEKLMTMLDPEVFNFLSVVNEFNLLSDELASEDLLKHICAKKNLIVQLFKNKSLPIPRELIEILIHARIDFDKFFELVKVLIAKDLCSTRNLLWARRLFETTLMPFYLNTIVHAMNTASQVKDDLTAIHDSWVTACIEHDDPNQMTLAYNVMNEHFAALEPFGIRAQGELLELFKKSSAPVDLARAIVDLIQKKNTKILNLDNLRYVLSSKCPQQTLQALILFSNSTISPEVYTKHLNKVTRPLYFYEVCSCLEKLKLCNGNNVDEAIVPILDHSPHIIRILNDLSAHQLFAQFASSQELFHLMVEVGFDTAYSSLMVVLSTQGFNVSNFQHYRGNIHALEQAIYMFEALNQATLDILLKVQNPNDIARAMLKLVTPECNLLGDEVLSLLQKYPDEIPDIVRLIESNKRLEILTPESLSQISTHLEQRPKKSEAGAKDKAPAYSIFAPAASRPMLPPVRAKEQVPGVY